MSLEKVGNIGFGDTTRVAKVLAELQGLKIKVVAGADANTAIALANIETEDTIAAVLNLTDATEVDVTHVSIIDRRASGTITVGTDVVADDYVTVNGKRYTFKELVVTKVTTIPPYVVPIHVTPSGIDANAVAAALATAIMSGDSSITCTVVDNVVTVIWRTAGTAGNTKTLATSSAHCTVSGATLSGGTASNGIKISDSTSAKSLAVVWYDKQ